MALGITPPNPNKGVSGMINRAVAFPSAPRSPRLSLSISESDEVRNRDLIIATLVNMLGGAVTIQPSEVEAMRNKTLTSIHQLDPGMLILKVEDE